MMQVAISDLEVAVFDADILVFVVPYQYIHDVCDKLRGKVKSTALGVSCVKVRLQCHSSLSLSICISVCLSVSGIDITRQGAQAHPNLSYKIIFKLTFKLNEVWSLDSQKNVATRCHILKIQCIKFDLKWRGWVKGKAGK